MSITDPAKKGLSQMESKLTEQPSWASRLGGQDGPSGVDGAHSNWLFLDAAKLAKQPGIVNQTADRRPAQRVVEAATISNLSN